jgi:hypothetical protein
MFLPVQIPTAVELEGPQGSQGITGLFTPVHALMFPSPGDDQIVTFFDMSTADVLALCPALPVVGDVGLPVGQVVDQLVEFGEVLGLCAVFFQDVQSVLHLAAPEVFDQQAQQLGFGFTATADQAGQVIAFLAAVIPIQDEGCPRPSRQTFLEEAGDSACAVTQQGDFGVQTAATQSQQEEQLLGKDI